MKRIMKWIITVTTVVSLSAAAAFTASAMAPCFAAESSAPDAAVSLPEEEDVVQAILDLKSQYDMSTITAQDIRNVISQMESATQITFSDSTKDYVVSIALSVAKSNPSDSTIRDTVHSFYGYFDILQSTSAALSSKISKTLNWLVG